jgi:hypothetical protein
MWKDIEFNVNYEISSEGIVRRKQNKNVLKGCITSGYRSVKLTFDNSKQKRFYVHRLVALHFLENDNPKLKTQVNHKDGNKLNNDVKNLEWVSPRENNLHYYQMQNQKVKKRKSGGKSIPIIQYTLDGKEVARYPSMNKAKSATGISIVQIARCVHGEISQASNYIFKQQ